MPGALEECCAYFCTGLSVFGVLGLVRAPPSFNSLRTPLCAARQRRGGGLRSARVSQCPPPRPRSSSWATRSSRATTGSSASQRRRANRSLCARPLHPFAGHCEDRCVAPSPQPRPAPPDAGGGRRVGDGVLLRGRNLCGVPLLLRRKGAAAPTPYSPHSLPPLLFAFEPLLPMTPRPALAATGDVMVGEKG